MELRHLRYFVAVAGELHFGRAAAKLHISQPPLSQQIQDLERELGVDLLRRSRHFVELTDAGRSFLEEARHILADSDRAAAEARRVGRGEMEHLSVGFGPLVAAGILGRIINAFQARRPDSTLDLQALSTAEQVDALVDRRVDVAFPMLPVSHRHVSTQAVVVEHLFAALPAHHGKAPAPTISLSDLSSERFVSFSRAAAPTYHDLVVRACGDAGFAPTVEHEANYILTILGLVGTGLGVAIVPAWIANRPFEGVVFRPLSDVAPVQIGVAHRRDNRSGLVLAFCEAARSVSTERPIRPLRVSARA